MAFLDYNKIKFNDIVYSTNKWLRDTYSQSKNVFSKSSPFGQIIAVLQEYSQLFFYYLEDSLVEMNILTASKQRSIYGWSRIAGHNPTRALSAQGTINVKLKKGSQDIPSNSSYIMILDKTNLTCVNNGKNYFVQLGNNTGNIRINTNSLDIIPLKIVQGSLETQTLYGTGEVLQSFNVTSKSIIENEMVWVYVNGELFENVDSLYDMSKGSKQCIVKTGISDGIDIYFGNEDYGIIPSLGQTIQVTYVKTEGYNGNIYSKSNNISFKFVDSGYSNTGEEVDLNKVLNISIENAIILGADSESVNVTKLIAPMNSKSFVLANPNNYIHLLSRFNYSYVNAYTTYNQEYIDDSNIVYLFLLPDLSRRLLTSTDYFSTSLSNFILSSDEKTALYNYIDMSGQQIATSEIQIIDPIIKRYAMNVYLQIYDSVDANTLKNEILSKVSNYMLSVVRRDKIPKSDLISIIDKINGVDSVNVSFVSHENEQAIIDGYYIQKVSSIDKITGLTIVTENQVYVDPGTDPNLGLDDFGDIVIGLNELPVLRGDFYDRFGNYFEDSIDFNQFCSLNIIVKNVLPETLSIKLSNTNKQSI